jgi:hypothetical protein
MSGWQLVDPAEDRPQQLVERSEGQVRFSLSGLDAEDGESLCDREFHAGPQKSTLADPRVAGDPHCATVVTHIGNYRRYLRKFGFPTDQE